MMNTQAQAEPQRFSPARRLDGLTPYSPPVKTPFVDLSLDANEGMAPNKAVLEALLGVQTDQIRRYHSTSELEVALATRFGVEENRVVVTNGADDAIDRVCRVALEPGRELLVHVPTFEMIERSARLAGGTVRSVDWLEGRFPVRAMVEAISENTSLVALVSPNNPTGGTIQFDEMLEIVRAAAGVGAVVMVDLAYIEFASLDPTGALLDEPNVVVVRTFSKAMGLAGARVGYALASAELANWLRTVGGPYPVGVPSLALAIAALAQEPGRQAYIDRVRSERESLSGVLRRFGCGVLDSQANFVTTRFAKHAFVQRALASLGVSVRAFPGRPELDGFLRITLPGNTPDFDRLEATLRTVLEPEAILFDLDGVLADVSRSCCTTILETARTFGVELTLEDVGTAKRSGDANNDWELTKRLIEQRGTSCELGDVVARFQRIYLGTPDQPGLRETECSIVDPELLGWLKDRYSLGVVTGRPRDEAEWFLKRVGIRGYFASLICMEDAPAKSSPEPVERAMNDLSVTRAWMIGDTPDDVVAARMAGVLPIGIVAPGDDPRMASEAMFRSGAASVINELSDIQEMSR